MSSSDDENASAERTWSVEDVADSGVTCHSRDEIWRSKTMLSKKVRVIGQLS